MKKNLITIFVLLSSSLYAATEDVTFKMIDKDLGVYNGDYHIKDDRQRLSLLASHGSNLMGIGDMYAIEANYGLKVNEVWVEAFIRQTTAKFDTLFGDQDNTFDSVSMSGITETILSTGIGMGYRFNYIQELLGSNKWYESTTVFATYNLMEEDYTAESFQGFGLRTDFGVHYRMSSSTQIGFKGIYHVTSLVRGAQDETEKRADRSLTAASLSFAFEYGMYF